MFLKAAFLSVALLGLGTPAQSQESWASYLTVEDDQVLSVRYNTYAAEQSVEDVTTYTVTVGMKAARADGARSMAEFDALVALEDALASVVIGKGGAFLGARSGGFQVEMAFEAPSDVTGLRGDLNAVVAEHGYGGTTEQTQDPNRRVFRTKYLPDPQELVRQNTQEVLMQLQIGGDALTQARPISHYVYFSKDVDAQVFAAMMDAHGFFVDVRNSDGDVLVILQHTSVPDLWMLSDVSFQLAQDAEKHSGFYNGWETVLVTAADNGD